MSDSSDGEVTKGWAVVNQDGKLEDSDDGSSTSSCDIAMDEDVVHFRHTPRRSSSVVRNDDPMTPTNLMVPDLTVPSETVSAAGVTPSPNNSNGESNFPANFWAQQSDRDQMASSTQSSDSNTNSNPQFPMNQWPQGARPKTTNNQHHLPANLSPEQSLHQSSSSASTSTLTEDPKPASLSSPDDDQDDGADTDDEVDQMLAARISEEKADTSSMSSIEILNMPASNEWDGREEVREERFPVTMESVMCSSALSVEAEKPIEHPPSDHHSSSSDSDFVRVDQSMMAEENHNLEEQQDGVNAQVVDNEANVEGAVGRSPYVDQEDRWNESLRIGASSLDGSQYSLDDHQPMAGSLPRVVEVSHPSRHHPRILPEKEEEHEEFEESHRFPGEDILGRRYFAKRLNRELSGSRSSRSSSASDLSSFSFLGLGRRSGRHSINRQHSDDMSEISSVFTDGSDDLPANMMVGTTKPGPKQYKHKRAERLNTRLNYLVLLVLASVLALGIGHYVGSYQEKYYKHQIREGQVKRLRELQDDLITCLDKRTTETDNKKTFADMVKSLLRNSVKEVLSDADVVVDKESSNDKLIPDDDNNDEGDIDCDSCREGKNRYSENCNTLCVQGGFWDELDEAISELPLPEESMTELYDGPEDEGFYEEVSVEPEETEDIIIDTPLDDIPLDSPQEQVSVTPDESGNQGGYWSELDDAIWEEPLPEDHVSDSGESKSPQNQDSVPPVESINQGRFCDSCREGKNRYSKKCNTLCVQEQESATPDDSVNQGGFWSELDDAIVTDSNVMDSEFEDTNLPQNEDQSPEEIPEEINSENLPGGEQVYTYDEVMAIKNKFDKKLVKQDNLEEEEEGYTAEKIKEIPAEQPEEMVTIMVEKGQDKLEEEEDGYIGEKVIHMPPVVEEEQDINVDVEDYVQDDVPPVVEEEEVPSVDVVVEEEVVEEEGDVNVVVEKEDIDVVEEEEVVFTSDVDDEDDDLVFVEVEDEDGNLHVDTSANKEYRHSQSAKQDHKEEVLQEGLNPDLENLEETPEQEQDTPEPEEEIQIDVTDASTEDAQMMSRLRSLEEQLQVAKARADMWQGKFVGDQHSRSHPEVIVVDNKKDDSKSTADSGKKIEELKDQLQTAEARADMWEDLYHEKSQQSRSQTGGNDKQKKESHKSEGSKEKSEKDTCGPLGCFTIFENILTNFLQSPEGQEFLRFANLSQVLNNASFWEEFKTATNITAYTISDAVYQSHVEFQDYVKSAQSSEFISSFSAVLTRTGKSVATAFGAMKNYSTTVGDKAQKAWSSVTNFTSDTIDQHNIHLNNISQLKEKVTAAWDTVRNMSGKVNNDTKKKFSDVVDKVHENVKDYVGHFHDNFQDFGKSVTDSWTSVKDTVGKWHHEKKHGKKHKNKGKRCDRWEEDEDVARTDGDDDVSSESKSRRQTKSDDRWSRDEEETGHRKHGRDEKCKGKKCSQKKDKKQSHFGPKDKKGKRNKHHKEHKDEKHFGPEVREGKRNKHEHHRHEHKNVNAENHDKRHKPNKHQTHTRKDGKKHGMHNEESKHERAGPSFDSLWDIDWEDILDVFNMNCYGVLDCMSHQRSDAAKLYDELTNYKKCLKTQDRKRELKEVRKFLEALGEFLSEPELDDEDLENLKEDFEEVLEKVGRFVQDQHDRSSENVFDDDESEINSTVVLDLDMLNKGSDDEPSSHSVPEKRKFAGFGYQRDDDDDNWFLRRAKDREDHYQDRWTQPPLEDGTGGQDVNWYLHWMQGRTDSRTGVTVWDMYRWITDRVENREDMRQYEEINWFLKRP